MKVNGEIKILWAMTVVAFMYVAYLVCTPNPEDGTLLMAVVAPVILLAGGKLGQWMQTRKLRYD